MKNIDTAFRHIKIFSLLFLISCTAITIYMLYLTKQKEINAQNKIFILANDKAIEAFASDRNTNIPVETRSHVKTFHQLFFALDPDDKMIQSNMARAFYLADRSAKREYDNLKENGFYSNLIAGNVSQELQVDSVTVDIRNYPYYFRFYGEQRIIRPSTIATRSLVTEGYLRSVARSDNNPHGFLIEKWHTLENLDRSVHSR